MSPVKLSEEVYQYYHKLLGMKAQSSYSDHSDINQTPNDEDNEDFESRYKVVVPDAVDRFPVSMYVCMYVCTCVCVCTYVCTYISTYVRMYLCIRCLSASLCSICISCLMFQCRISV